MRQPNISPSPPSILHPAVFFNSCAARGPPPDGVSLEGFLNLSREPSESIPFRSALFSPSFQPAVSLVLANVTVFFQSAFPFHENKKKRTKSVSFTSIRKRIPKTAWPFAIFLSFFSLFLDILLPLSHWRTSRSPADSVGNGSSEQ